MRFRHSGKLGDAIYALPAIRAMGGGELLLRPSPALGFTEEGIEALLPLLETQGYVKRAARWSHEEIDVDLDQFRLECPELTNLVECHLLACSMPLWAKERAWIEVQDPLPVDGRPVVFARSPDHRGAPGFWETCHRLLGGLAIFVGTSAEHEAFCRDVGDVPYRPTENLHELARLIAGCRLFVGNQSCPYAIAEGLKAPAILEVDPRAPNCLFARVDSLPVWDVADGGLMIRAFTARVLGRSSLSGDAIGRQPVVDHKTARLLGPSAIAGTSVVVLTFNSKSTIRACLDSVISTLMAGDELVVVDNASWDGTQEILQEYARSDLRVRLILCGENLGFSAGCNLGMRASRGVTVCLLNPDTVVRPCWLDWLNNRLKDPNVGAVGPVSDNVSGDQYVGFHLPEDQQSGLSQDELASSVALRYGGATASTKLLVGFCIALRRETLDRVGLLDESMFLGSEDLELSWRLRTHGYQLAVARDVFVHHQGGASFGEAPTDGVQRLLADSTAALKRKLSRHYHPRAVPSSTELFGSGIMDARPEDAHA